MLGLSTRKYGESVREFTEAYGLEKSAVSEHFIEASRAKLKCGQAVREFTEAYGLEKSAVSEHFIEASRAKLKDMMERRLDKVRLCALLIDATPFEGQQMAAALGIGEDGRKTILGIRQGATENATVVGELLGDLVERGLDFVTPRLYVLDGGKALTAAVKKYAGETAPIQRCQIHKRRNVLD